MAVSSIKEKLGKLLVNIGIKKIEQFGYDQLKQLQNSKKPFCFQYSDKHYSIGDFDIRIQQDNTARVYKDSKFLHHFQNRQVAIYYCAYEKLYKFSSSDTLLQVDTELALARAEYDILYFKLNNKKSNSVSNRDIILAKFQEAYARLKKAESEFKKTMLTHKYSKIWDTIL
jgi:hypothetical protein